MRDKLVIIAAIVAIHFIILLLFVFSGEDDTESTTPESPSIEQSDTTSSQGNAQTSPIASGDNTNEDLFSEIATEESSSTATSGQKYTVKPGDNLSKISMKVYGNKKYYNFIYEANNKILKSPQALRPGQELIIPPRPE